MGIFENYCLRYFKFKHELEIGQKISSIVFLLPAKILNFETGISVKLVYGGIALSYMWVYIQI